VRLDQQEGGLTLIAWMLAIVEKLAQIGRIYLRAEHARANQ
jgi:hypothetical protein